MKPELFVGRGWLFRNIMVKGRSITEPPVFSTGTGIWSHHCSYASTLKQTFTWLIFIELKVIVYLHVSLKIKFCWRDLFSFVGSSFFFLMTAIFRQFKGITVNKKYYYFVQVCKLKSALLFTHGLVYFYMCVVGWL